MGAFRIPTSVSFHGKQVIIRTSRLDWNDGSTIINSQLFRVMLANYIKNLREHESDFLKLFPKADEKKQEDLALLLLKKLALKPGREVVKANPELKPFFADTYALDQFVEGFYNYWRSFERFLVTYSNPKEPKSGSIDKKPYTVFNDTIEKLNHMVRKIYREIREHITGEHPIIYRQVPAGCQVGGIAAKKRTVLPKSMEGLVGKIHVIRQVLIQPPLIIDPPNNKRKGEFAVVHSNPLEGVKFNADEWLCFPAKVGELTVHFYFHNFYMGLGISVSNLFELCTDGDLRKKPDAVYAYGVPPEALEKFAPEKTVFYNDEKNSLMVGAIPLGDEFAYFGYVKKMMLTLYNSIMIKRGRMPVHGAMTRITMKSGASANVIIFGDTGTGKSESLEAFRILSEGNLKDMKIVFDDMGSLELQKDGSIKAFGTETGAFVRLDDLQAGYAFGNIDRSIIMSPQKINARAGLPITTLQENLHGWPIAYFLYANNYDEVNSGKYLEFFSSPEQAMEVFREGKRMAKGTTNETGLVTAYYANIFGPSQFRAEHEKIAGKFFGAMFKTGVKVGQIRTQLGIKGMETPGPQLAAKALFGDIVKNKGK